ncbi:hypothetical protein ASPBRDRAFT_29669 [Aspergillus brasiliensis CBS 101740]|uniref:Uncharacterized protein n=1 Tax=Aspergillus brasiliensis (strain CBS 101740 / IMI 381727 / IBT 21946) TaxID=767769 RepID=A0A1L9UM15_ASPBC|nr:hypothetical protein ASPBRDRAFT_29669 [Aspergillus brasiliensis CBS 101740]
MYASDLALTGEYPPAIYRGIEDIARAIAALTERLERQNVSQYLSYKPVTPEDFDYIEQNRDELGSTVRLTYYEKINTLIVKIPTPEFEIAHVNIGLETYGQLRSMNIPRVFEGLGARRCKGHNSSKEADSSYKNYLIRPGTTAWPTFVIESGVSESWERLKMDVSWWIAESRGTVNLILLVKVKLEDKSILIEKYVPKVRKYPYTRSQTSTEPHYVPELVSQTEIRCAETPRRVSGAIPLVLGFEDLMDRPPVTPEKDVEFDVDSLQGLGGFVFPP